MAKHRMSPLDYSLIFSPPGIFFSSLTTGQRCGSRPSILVALYGRAAPPLPTAPASLPPPPRWTGPWDPQASPLPPPPPAGRCSAASATTASHPAGPSGLSHMLPASHHMHPSTWLDPLDQVAAGRPGETLGGRPAPYTEPSPAQPRPDTHFLESH